MFRDAHPISSFLENAHAIRLVSEVRQRPHPCRQRPSHRRSLHAGAAHVGHTLRQESLRDFASGSGSLLLATGATRIIGRPTRCASAIAGFASSSCPCSDATGGCFSIFERAANRGCPHLSREEVRSILACVRAAHNHAFLSTVYACGLRLQEALFLEVCDIDANRMMITCIAARGRRTAPMAKSSVQGAFRRTKLQAGIHKTSVRSHTRGHYHRSGLRPDPIVSVQRWA